MQLSLGAWQIRDLDDRDEDALVEYANEQRVSSQLRDVFPYPYTRVDARAFLDGVANERPRSSFAIASAQQLIGGIGLHRFDDVHRRSAEIGYWLALPYWGRGIATLAVRALSDWAFASTDLVRLGAGVFETNPASARVLEKAGYTLEGRLRRHVTKNGRTLDQLMYARVRD